MKIDFKPWVYNLNLFFSFGYLVWFFIYSFTNDHFQWSHYGSLILAIVFYNIYIYQRQNKYLTIENGFISKNRPFGKIIDLREIQFISFNKGIYTLKTENDHFTINTTLIDKKSLQLLQNELNHLNVVWD